MCASVVSALDGHFGDYHHPATASRTRGSKLFINPLMSIFWCFDLHCVAEEVKYLPLIAETKAGYEISSIIEEWRDKHLRDKKKKFLGRVQETFPH